MYMNKLIKKQLVLILFTVVLVGTLVVTTSFAVFEDTKSNAQDQKMAVGDLDITFTGGSAINITNLSPMTDTVAKSQTNNLYTFSIANTGTVPYKFTVKLENNPSYTSNLLSHKYIRYSLNNAAVKFVSDNSGLLVEGTIEAGVTNNYSLRLWVADAETYKLPDSTLGQEIHLKINVDGKAGSILAPAPDGWYDASSGTLLAAIRRDNELRETLTTPGAATSYSIDDTFPSGVFNANAYYTYGDTYKVNADGTYTIENPKNVKYSEGFSTLLGKYMVSSTDDYSDVLSDTDELLETTNKKQLLFIRDTWSEGFTYSKISGGMKTFPEEPEAVMASAADDYGTSYYFRGAVENNYVEFANKCWRIVRVTGDGSIKLTLFNNNTEGNTNPCAEANDSVDAAITGESKFNYAYGDNAFVGLMYGNVGCSDGVSDYQGSCTRAGGTWTASTSYVNAHANINKSTILKYLESWYDDNIASYDSYIADTIWCNDKSTVKDTTFNPYGWSGFGTNYGYGLNTNYYGVSQRLLQNDEYALVLAGNPSLICPNDDLGGKLSKYTVSDTTNGNGALDKKIGLLTADEVVYAGGGDYNESYYLLKNTENWIWWALSPSGSDGGGGDVWVVRGVDSVLSYESVEFEFDGVRPSLSLKSTVPIASGKGTRTSPYVVE